jgi:hypothetical protein
MPWVVEQLLAAGSAAVALKLALSLFETVLLPFHSVVRKARKAARWRRKVFSFGRTATRKRHHDYGR